MLERLRPGEVLLAPCQIQACLPGVKESDAHLEVMVPGLAQVFRFAVESKTRSTPESIRMATAQVRCIARKLDAWPMIYVPFLSGERIAELEAEGVSGVDLCGNGVVMVPGKICVVRTGNPNKYRDSRPLNNPFRGRSGLVARMLLKKRRWQTLSDLAAEIEAHGRKISLGQVSKAIHALNDEALVSKKSLNIELRDPLALLDRMAAEWKKCFVARSCMLRLPPGLDWVKRISSSPRLQWAVTGESSVGRYLTFSQSGPRRIAVSNLDLAIELLGDGVQQERVLNFADVQLREIEEPGCYFDNEIDGQGMRWASKLQTWLELQAGDGRQSDAASELRSLIIKEFSIS